MENFSLDSLKKVLSGLKEEGITLEGKQQSWTTEEDVKDVVTAILEAKVLHYLKLDGNTLGVEAANAIGKALAHHSEFRKAFWQNLFTGRLKNEIPKALTHLGNGLISANAHLTVLDLSDNALGPNGMSGLEGLLRSSVCFTLQELLLNNCGLGINGAQMLSKALLDCYNASCEAGSPLQLKVFIAGRNRLEDAGSKALATVFSAMKTLEEITMPQNGIRHRGIAALADAIKVNPHLGVLNLNDNTLTTLGAASLAQAMAYTPNLRELNLGDCLVRTEGALSFSEALRDNHNNLELIDLGFNEISLDGGLALLDALRPKPHLKSVYLNGNQFGCEGRQRIKEAVEEFHNTSVLDDLDEDNSEDEYENQADQNDDEYEDVDDVEDDDGEDDDELDDDDGEDEDDDADDDVDDDEDDDDEGEENENDDDEIYYGDRHNDTTEAAIFDGCKGGTNDSDATSLPLFNRVSSSFNEPKFTSKLSTSPFAIKTPMASNYFSSSSTSTDLSMAGNNSSSGPGIFANMTTFNKGDIFSTGANTPSSGIFATGANTDTGAPAMQNTTFNSGIFPSASRFGNGFGTVTPTFTTGTSSKKTTAGSPLSGNIFGIDSDKTSAGTPTAGNIFGIDTGSDKTTAGTPTSGNIFGTNSDKTIAGTLTAGTIFGSGSDKTTAGTPTSGNMFSISSDKTAGGTLPVNNIFGIGTGTDSIFGTGNDKTFPWTPTTGTIFSTGSHKTSPWTPTTGNIFGNSPKSAITPATSDTDNGSLSTGNIFTSDAATTDASKPVTAKEFCLSRQPCTLQMFNALQEKDKLNAFHAIIEKFSGDDSLLILIFTTLKCAHLSRLSTEALHLAISLYNESFAYAIEQKQERRILNYYLMQLGLLRSEHKFISNYNNEACRYALRETLKKHKIASAYMNNVFSVFLEQGDN